MAKTFCIILMILWGASSQAKLSSMQCSPNSLATQNCHIQWSTIKVHIRGNKVNSFDGVHRSLVEFPVAGENVEWKKLRLRRLSGRLFLEAEVWGAPSEKTDVSELNWLVYSFENVKPVLKVNKKIQRRKKKEAEKMASKFELLDKALKHKIFTRKKRHYWSHGFEEGEL